MFIVCCWLAVFVACVLLVHAVCSLSAVCCLLRFGWCRCSLLCTVVYSYLFVFVVVCCSLIFSDLLFVVCCCVFGVWWLAFGGFGGCGSSFDRRYLLCVACCVRFVACNLLCVR